MASCSETQEFLVKQIKTDIEAHERGEFAQIGEMWDMAPPLTGCEKAEERQRLAMAVDFWDCWTDAKNHDWHHYPGIGRNDWPRLARKICQGLEEGWELKAMHVYGVNSVPKPFRPSFGHACF